MFSGVLSPFLSHAFIMFFLVHFFACVAYLIAKYEGLSNSWISSFADAPPLERYVVSLYFVLTTILTTGYGDLHAVTPAETVVCIFIIVVGVVFEATIIAQMMNILSSASSSQFLDSYESLQKYLKFKKVKPTYHDHVRHYYQHLWDEHQGAPEWKELLRGVPTSIKSAVKLEVCQKAFMVSELFHQMEQSYLLMMLDTSVPFTFLPGQVIYTQGEHAYDLWVFNSGIIETILDGSSIGTMTADKPFIDGERSLFFDEPTTKTLKAVSFVDGWKLSRESFLNLLRAKRENIE